MTLDFLGFSSYILGMKQIIAMGGGSFGSEPRNPLLDKFILAQSKSARPKICFISTASGDSDNYIRKFIDAYYLCRWR